MSQANDGKNQNGKQGGSPKPFTVIAGVVFAVVAGAHLLRIVYGLDVTVGGWTVPMWVSYLGCVVPAILAVMLWREAGK